MKEIHFSLVPNRSAKQQALEVISKLQQHMPITRAKMKIQITVALKDAKATKKYLEQHNVTIVEQKIIGDNSNSRSDGVEDALRLVCFIDPGVYRGLDAFVHEPNGR